jgi:acetylornithine deacetylase/succinyl-diaminopimelate desuccinylase-like protein
MRTGERDLHSGVYGGAALNALHALAQTLAPLLPHEGRLPEPLRSGVVPPTPRELVEWSALPAGDDLLAKLAARPADGAAARELYLRTWAEPSLDLHGIAGGSTGQKTIVPAEAEATFSIRLVADQQPRTIAAEVDKLVREACPPGSDVNLELLAATPPASVAEDAPAITLALEAFERALGIRPVLVRSGGTLPVAVALQQRAIPTIVTGFDLPEGNIHAANERLLLEYIPLGLAAARELFRSFAYLPQGCARTRE